jgi:hypothetical protein
MVKKEANVHEMSNRGRRKMTIQERLDAFLERQGNFVPLKAIYKFFRAKSVGERAGIRGLLNKDCGKGGRYRRNKKEIGQYTLAA